MKKIAIFCDGTWNEPDHEFNGRPCPTNVVKLASLVPPLSEQAKRPERSPHLATSRLWR